ncbi:hypothetical protein LG299_03695 [Microbacterium lacus]|uniref:hypothetical protein n=1 Tax=Microbacterium lacus TaxID=415217 RepID=UPI0038506C46
MADLSPSTRVAASWVTAPVAVRVGVLYLAARFVTTGLLLLAANLSTFGSRFGPDATLATLVTGWDAQWYWYVAVHGYPTVLPLTGSGQVAENQWAFMPLYAYLSEAVGLPFGAWAVGAVIVSLVAGYLASLVLFRMLTPKLGDPAAMWAVVFFAAGPLAALFQVGYAEALFLLWLFLSLWAVMQRRYGWLYLLIPLMGFTRPGVLAFALFLALHGIHRWLTRRTDSLTGVHVVHIVALGAWAVIVGFSWQVIAAAVTGDADAYLATELAWRRNWGLGGEGFVPVEGFIQGAAFWFTQWGLGPIVGYVALAVTVIGFAAFLVFVPQVKKLGVDLRLWAASYGVYLLLVFFPQSSIFRLLLPMSPLVGAFAVPRSTVWRVGVLCACLGGQWWWIYTMYALGDTIERVP